MKSSFRHNTYSISFHISDRATWCKSDFVHYITENLLVFIKSLLKLNSNSFLIILQICKKKFKFIKIKIMKQNSLLIYHKMKKQVFISIRFLILNLTFYTYYLHYLFYPCKPHQHLMQFVLPYVDRNYMTLCSVWTVTLLDHIWVALGPTNDYS